MRTNKQTKKGSQMKPTDKMLIDVLASKIKGLDYSLLKSETKVQLQEEEILKLKKEIAELKYQAEEVA